MTPFRLIRLWLLSLILAALIVVAVHMTAERTIMGEVRGLLDGVAATAAEGLMALPDFGRDFQFIDGSLDPIDPRDPRHDAFDSFARYLRRVQARFREGGEGALALTPRVHSVYTLRRLQAVDPIHPVVVDETGNVTDERDVWQYVVCADWYDRDENGDGVIAADERGRRPGLHLDHVSDLPALEITLEMALQRPVAETEAHSDAFGTWLSGYAPLFDDSGTAIGVLGVDLRQSDLQRVLLRVRTVSAGAWLAIALLITLAFYFLSGRVRAYQKLERRDAQIAHRNEELRAINHRLAVANREFAKQLDLAQRVQQGFLPTQLPRTDKIAFDSIYLACEAVGGDIYDVFPIDDSTVALYIADVSGHGISAALIGATLKMSVEAMKTAVSLSGHAHASILSHPRDVIIRLHNILKENLSREHFITMQYATISTKTNTMTLCNAGHTWPVCWRTADHRAEMIETNSGLPIGYVMEEVLVEQEIPLDPGDKVILYTDGLTECHGTDPDEMFGEERLATAIAACGDAPAQEVVSTIKRAVDDFSQGVPSPDDVALIVAEILTAEEVRVAS